MKIFILLPAFNEELSIPTLLYQIDKTLKNHKYEYKVILCNDGSTDNTKKIVELEKEKYPIH